MLSRSWCATLSSASFRDLHRRRANAPGQLKVFFSSNNNDKISKVDGSLCFYAWQPGGAPPTKLPACPTSSTGRHLSPGPFTASSSSAAPTPGTMSATLQPVNP
ncbi:hypothetical protein D1007_46814 [Hordeum vulgare]|nr:hypothetical protein D1007_46814 [Hordeum vulgare]